MTTRFKPLPPSSVVEIAGEVLDAIRENTRMQEVLAAQQNRLTEVLARLLIMDPNLAQEAAEGGQHDRGVGTDATSVISTSEKPSYTDMIKGRTKVQILADAADKRDRILDLWAQGELSKAEIARRIGMNERNVRRIIEKAALQGDPRAAGKNTSPADSSLQGTGRTQRKDFPDPAAGEEAGLSPVASSVGQSGTEHTEEAQGRNEPVSASPVSAATAGEVSASPAVRAGSSVATDEMIEAGKAIGLGLIASGMRQTRESGGKVTGGVVPSKSYLVGKNPTTVIIDELADENFAAAVAETMTIKKPTFTGMDLGAAESVTVEVTIPARATAPQPTASKPDFMYVPGGVIGWDEKTLKIAGPKGVLDADLPILLSLKHMADGGLYDIGTLAERGGWEKKDKLYECLRSWRTRLPKVGVELVFVGKELFKLRALED